MAGEFGTFQRCTCEQVALRRRVYSNGNVSFCDQCLRCGRSVRTYKAHMLPHGNLTPWDDAISREFWEGVNQRTRTAYEQRRAGEEEEWRRRYDAHMRSDKWRDLRQKVFRRSRGICEGCGERRAVQVHHLSYKHMGDEFLFELAAICIDCHQRLHPHYAPDGECLEDPSDEGEPEGDGEVAGCPCMAAQPVLYAVGMTVRHANYGVGKVVQVSDHPPGGRVTVRFRSYGDKTFLTDKVKLEVVG